VIFFSGFSKDLLLFVKDVKLFDLVFDFGGKEVNLLSKCLDLVAGISDFSGGEFNSSVISVDFGFTVDFGGSILKISFLLLEEQVLSQILEHLGNISKRSLVFHLKSDGV